MDKIKIHFDPSDNSLMVWFDEQQNMAYLSPIEENMPGNFHLIKAEDGRVIDMECQFYHLRPGSVSVELQMACMLTEQDLMSRASSSNQS